jgi:hypothetical protein
VHILQTPENLVQEVLDELLFERAGGEEAVQVGSEEFGDEVAGKSAESSLLFPPLSNIPRHSTRHCHTFAEM